MKSFANVAGRSTHPLVILLGVLIDQPKAEPGQLQTGLGGILSAFELKRPPSVQLLALDSLQLSYNQLAPVDIRVVKTTRTFRSVFLHAPYDCISVDLRLFRRPNHRTQFLCDTHLISTLLGLRVVLSKRQEA